MKNIILRNLVSIWESSVTEVVINVKIEIHGNQKVTEKRILISPAFLFLGYFLYQFGQWWDLSGAYQLFHLYTQYYNNTKKHTEKVNIFDEENLTPQINNIDEYGPVFVSYYC